MTHENGHHEAALGAIETNGAETGGGLVRSNVAHKPITAASLLTAIAAKTGRKRRHERESDAVVVRLVIDALLPVVRRHVEREWSGNDLLSELEGLKGDGDGE